MQVYIFDTDHLSLYGRANPFLIARLQASTLKLTTTVINVEEQLRGRLAQISEIKDGENNLHCWGRTLIVSGGAYWVLVCPNASDYSFRLILEYCKKLQLKLINV